MYSTHARLLLTVFVYDSAVVCEQERARRAGGSADERPPGDGHTAHSATTAAAETAQQAGRSR